MAAVALLCGTIILFLMKEKKDALSMYHQMKVNDEMLRAAIGKSDALSDAALWDGSTIFSFP